jgi:hypothetical protein
MAKMSFEVKYYSLQLGNGGIGNEKFVASLVCQNASSNPTPRLYVYFVSDGMKLPASSCNTSNKTGRIFRPISQMGLFIDVLRNEKPINVVMDDDRPDWISLRTEAEPAGEGE